MSGEVIRPGLIEATCAWHVRLACADCSAPERARLQRWLDADPEHRRAFEQARTAWNAFDTHAAAPEMIAVRRDALDRARRAARGRRTRWRLKRPVFATAAALFVAAAIALLVPIFDGVDVYRTGINERRVVMLADGSRVHLDAASELSVRYSDDARALRLVKGQAYFDVVHELTRPFKVAARDKTVVATGTAFNIDILGLQVAVTLIEGQVVVLEAQGRAIAEDQASVPSQRIPLSPGEQLIAVADAPARILPTVDVRGATAWEQGELVFDNERLADAVARVNRYSDRRIVIGDAVAAEARISGVFHTGQVRAFIEGVTASLPVAATETPRGQIILYTLPKQRPLARESGQIPPVVEVQAGSLKPLHIAAEPAEGAAVR